MQCVYKVLFRLALQRIAKEILLYKRTNSFFNIPIFNVLIVNQNIVITRYKF